MTSAEIKSASGERLERRVGRISRILAGKGGQRCRNNNDRFMLQSERMQIVKELSQRDEIEVTQ